MFARNWDVWVEANYMDFGTKNVTMIGYGGWAGGQYIQPIQQNVLAFLVGIDYRFYWGVAPVVTKGQSN
jgi:hypothetical protein